MFLHTTRTIRAMALIVGVCLAAVFSLNSRAFAAVPAAVGDSYSTDANVALTVAAPGVLDNDTGVDPATTRIAAYDARTRAGGRVTLNQNGGFTYTPPAGFSGRDRFTYALENAEGTSQATVTIAVVGPVTWFVNASAPAGGNGTYAAPFNSFTPLNNSASDVDRPGHRIFVYPGTYTVGFALEANQTLIGATEGLTLPESGITIAPAARPTLTFAGNTLTLANGATVRGLRIASTGSVGAFAVRGTNLTSATLSNLTLPGSSTDSGVLSVNGLTGALNISDSTISGTFGPAAGIITLQEVTGSGAVSFTDTPITVTGGSVLALDNIAALSFDAASNITQTNGGGFAIAGLPASADLSFAGVNLTVNSAPAIDLSSSNANALVNFTEGLTLSGGGYTATAHRLSISGASSTIAAGTDTPLNLNSVAVQGMATFASITTATGASGGLLFTNSSGAVVATSATINVGAGDELVRLNGGSLNLTINGGTLAKTGTGAAVTVQNNHTGTLTNVAAVNVTGGDGFAFTDANGAYTHSGVVTLNGGAARVAVTGGSGMVTFSNTGSSITAQAGQPGFIVTTSSTSGSFAGTITKNTAGAPAVAITSLASGDTYTFGTVTAGNASQGVAFTTSNGNITFGTLNLGSSAARFTVTPIVFTGQNFANIQFGAISGYTAGAPVLAYSAAAGGALRSTSGIMDATNSAAVDIAPISGSQQITLNLTTVNATNSTRGIRLTNTGGNFTVAGDGGANFTAGGTISGMVESAVRLQSAPNVTLNNMSFTNANTSGAGSCTVGGDFICNGTVIVANVNNLTLNRIRVSGTTVDSALTGTGLNGLTVTNSSFDNVGSGEDRFVFSFRRSNANNLSGTVLIADSSFTNFIKNGIDVSNASGSLNLTVRNTGFTNNIGRSGIGCGKAVGCEGNGIVIDAVGTANITALVAESTFTEMDQRGVRFTVNGGIMNAVVRDNTFTPFPFSTNVADPNNRWAERGISFGATQGGQLTYNVQGNDLDDHRVTAIQVDAFDPGTIVVGAIRNNTIDLVAAGGTAGGRAIDVYGDAGSPIVRTEISENTLTNIGRTVNSATVLGINVTATGSAQMNARVANNTVNNSASFNSSHAVFLDAVSTGTLCVQVTGNTASANTSATPSNFGYRLRKGATATFRIADLTGDGSATATASYIASVNIGTASAIAGGGTAFISQACDFSAIPSSLP